MFHLSDLFTAAAPSPWTPPQTAPAEALPARYRRRRLQTSPDDAPGLKLPDAQHLSLLTTAALAAEGPAEVAAAAIGGCLETPVLAYASPALHNGSRCWRRLCLLNDLDVAGLLCLHATPGKRLARLHNVTLQLCDISDLDGVRALVEEVYRHGDRPERDVRDRGRATAPHAVWLGSPADDAGGAKLNNRLPAIAAVAGYRMRVVADPIGRTRLALQRTADLAPELVLAWLKYLPPGDFIARLRAIAPGAVVESVDATSVEEALDDARIWCTLAPVVARQPADPERPKTMRDAARWARERTDHLVIVDQAIARADKSPYESPEDVFDALLVLDQLAGDYSTGRLDGSTFEQACLDHNLLYSKDISRSARNKHGARYTVHVGDTTRVMGPHLRFGGSFDPRYCARVYWWVDPSSRRLIIGHIGEHLPGGGD